MVQSLQLGAPTGGGRESGMRRLNRLPIVVVIALSVVSIGIVVIGLSWRGLPFGAASGVDTASNSPATSYGEQLKRGIGDGIIGDPGEREAFQPAPTPPADRKPTSPAPQSTATEHAQPGGESNDDWKARLKREQEEQYAREENRQKMARLQAKAAALDSPLKVDVGSVEQAASAGPTAEKTDAGKTGGGNNASDLYATAMKAGLQAQGADPNGQGAKEDFFNQDIKDLAICPTTSLLRCPALN